MTPTAAELDFSLFRGGPFHRLAARLHLVDGEPFSWNRHAAILPLLCWLPPIVFAALSSPAHALDRIGAALADVSFGTRFLVGVPLLLLAESHADRWLSSMVAQLEVRNLVLPEERARLVAAVGAARGHRDSGTVELLLLIGACLLGSTRSLPPWLTSDGGVHLLRSAAVEWHALVSLSFLHFLMLRWLWRVLVWSALLSSISRLRLRLQPTHPDHAGGLAFLGSAHRRGFAVAALAFGAVFGAGVRGRLLDNASLVPTEKSLGVFIVLLLAVFLGPLLVFVPRLIALQQRGVLDYGALGQRYTDAFRRRFLDEHPGDGRILGAQEIQALADLGNSYQVIVEMSAAPFGRSDVLVLALAGLLPALLELAGVFLVGPMLQRMLSILF